MFAMFSKNFESDERHAAQSPRASTFFPGFAAVLALLCLSAPLIAEAKIHRAKLGTTTIYPGRGGAATLQVGQGKNHVKLNVYGTATTAIDRLIVLGGGSGVDVSFRDRGIKPFGRSGRYRKNELDITIGRNRLPGVVPVQVFHKRHRVTRRIATDIVRFNQAGRNQMAENVFAELLPVLTADSGPRCRIRWAGKSQRSGDPLLAQFLGFREHRESLLEPQKRHLD
jgi:hypothetical protein